MQSGTRSRNPAIASAPAHGLSRKSSRNSRKTSPVSASLLACSSRLRTSGKPRAIQIRGRDLVAAIASKELSAYHESGGVDFEDGDSEKKEKEGRRASNY